MQSANGGLTLTQKKRAVRAFSDHDAALIDDVRKALDAYLMAKFHPNSPSKMPYIVAFEAAVAKVVLARSGGK
jgi:anti-sigma factor RsiW